LPSEHRPQPRGRWALGGLGLLVLVLVALSPAFGRAHPTGAYRPPLPPDALTNGCYPLPDGVRLDLPYQVRSDGDAAGRRRLVLQYDLLDRDAAAGRLAADFARAGWRRTGADPARPTFTKDGSTVHAVVAALSPLTKEQIVRGTITLDLPSVAVRSSAPVCRDVTSTKRFPSDEASHDVGVPGGIN
jgi:hypothetical protein